jgi:hypothetical protein
MLQMSTGVHDMPRSVTLRASVRRSTTLHTRRGRLPRPAHAAGDRPGP